MTRIIFLNDSNFVLGILRDRIDHLRDLGIESLLLKNILQTNRGAYEEVTNFTNVNYYLESIDKFRAEIIEYAKSKGLISRCSLSNVKLILKFYSLSLFL